MVSFSCVCNPLCGISCAFPLKEFVHTLTHLIFTCSCSCESYEIFNAPTLTLKPTLDERLVEFHLEEDGIELSLRWPWLDRWFFF
jgi:hypothetical protein